MKKIDDGLVRALDGFLKSLCQKSEITVDGVRHSLPKILGGVVRGRAFLQTLVAQGMKYRLASHFRLLRTCLFVGTALRGKTFIVKAERAGLLLSDEMSRRKFGSFLSHFAEELQDRADEENQALHERLQTYVCYHRLAALVDDAGVQAVKKLRTRPRTLIKRLLAVTHLYFLNEYLAFSVSKAHQEWFARLGSPEEVASVASLLIALANEDRPLDSLDFAFPLGDELVTDDVLSIMDYGRDAFLKHETAKFISLFGYRLELARKQNPITFYLRPPSLDFEYALRLGFMRGEFDGSGFPTKVSEQNRIPRISLLTAADYFSSKFRHRIAEVRDAATPLRRVRMNFPKIPSLYTPVLEMTATYEDVLLRERLGKEFLIPLRRKSEKELQLTDELDLQTFLRLWRFLSFLGLVDIAALRQHADRDATIVHNSLVRVSQEEPLFGMLEDLGFSKAQVRTFFRLVAADTFSLGFYDLQYHPFLRIASNTSAPEGKVVTTPAEIIHLPGLVYLSNVLRNVQSANKFRLESNAHIFVDVVADLLGNRFKKVTKNQAITSHDRKTDVDVALLEDSTLYLFECKYSVPPTGPQELRGVWEDIEWGEEQLTIAMDILSDPSKRQSCLAGWFPGTRTHETKDLRIQSCILCSHLVFSGLQFRGKPVRDFASFSLLLGDGILKMGYIDEGGNIRWHRYKIVGEENKSRQDLDDYLNPDSRYFKIFSRFVDPVTRIESLAASKARLAHETYRYAVDLDDWVKQLAELGFQRLTDEEDEVQFPWSAEELEAKFGEVDWGDP